MGTIPLCSRLDRAISERALPAGNCQTLTCPMKDIRMTNLPLMTWRVTRVAWMLAALTLVATSGPQAAAAADAPAAASGAPPAGRYQLDKSHASLLFRVSHLGFSNYTTRASRSAAPLSLDPAKPPAPRVLVTIRTASFHVVGTAP